jgi:type I site-specific restriction endonuclease
MGLAAHTKAYFTDVVYRYEYGRAVREGYLVDFDAVSIKSNVRMAGDFLQEREEVGLIDPETGSEQLDRRCRGQKEAAAWCRRRNHRGSEQAE